MKHRKLKNLRDLHYIKSENNVRIKKNLILRSGYLFNLSPRCINKLNRLHIDKIIDLRSMEEVKELPDSKINSTYVNIPYDNPNVATPKDGVNRADYKTYIENRKCEKTIADREYNYYSLTYSSKIYNNEGLKEIFNTMSSHKSFLFHCRGGKDRTGVSALIILLTLGFTKEEAIKDYLKTNNKLLIILARTFLKILGFNKWGLLSLEINSFAIKSLIQSTLDEIYNNYSSIDDFLLKEYSITKETIDDWKSYYLE